MHILPLPHKRRETAGQVDPEILSLLHGRKPETGQRMLEYRLCILALSHGQESGFGKQESPIKFQKKAAPWGSFLPRIDE